MKALPTVVRTMENKRDDDDDDDDEDADEDEDSDYHSLFPLGSFNLANIVKVM